MKIRFLIAVLLTGNAIAATDAVMDCKKISSPTKRLACFDKKQNQELKSAEMEKAQATADEKKKKAVEFDNAAKVALNAIRKLETRVEIGVSYRDYPSLLSDAKSEVMSFVREEQSLARGEGVAGSLGFMQHLAKAMTHYEMAGTIWRFRFSTRNLDAEMNIPTDLREKYPGVETHIQHKYGLDLISYDKLLSIVWAAASEEIAEADKALNRK